MKCLIPLVEDKGRDSFISLHFGRAKYFAEYDTETKKIQITEFNLDHSAIDLTPIDQICKKFNPELLVVSELGQRAFKLLREKNILVKETSKEKISEIIDNILELEDLKETCNH